MSIRVLKSGFLSSVQDLGRDGYAGLGVGRSGAMDRPALQLANALVGNAPEAAALELTLIGPTLRFQSAATIALTGAEIDARIDGTALPLWRPIRIPAQSLLQLGAMRRGARSYLAISPGLRTRRWLGSASVDLNAGTGSALKADDILELVDAEADSSRGAVGRLMWPNWSLAPGYWFDRDNRPIRWIDGRHFSLLDAASQTVLRRQEFRIAQDSNRAGLRLQGAKLQLKTPIELVSEAVDFGSVQLPPGGDPIVLMAEHPTTGGYPRIGQIAAVDLPILAQRKPGDHLRFQQVGVDQAEALLVEQTRSLNDLFAEVGRRRAAWG